MTGNLHASRFCIFDADVDELREHYANTLKPVRVSPIDRRSTISVEDTHFSVGEFDIWSGLCQSGMEVNFSEPLDAYALYVPITGAMEMGGGGHQLTSAPGTLLAADLSKANLLRLHSERSHIGIAFSRQSVTRQLSELLGSPVIHDIELFAEYDARSGAGAKLAAMAQLLWDSLISEPAGTISARSTEFFFRTIMVALLENVPHRYSALLERPVSPAMPRQMKRAIDYMMANIATAVSVDEIARDAGVSARALQAAFKQFKNTTPLNYLRQLRLEGARKDLLLGRQDGVSISDIARQWGFTHVGRFSILYRETFGEMPTETRRFTRG
ncbi:AraC family transcriptional regulator [Rhizobium mongolense]|uniref:AraC-like DNA-binding protein n=2 Tax=Rhizobium mongolense TaxID=57676 RepID=A0ABR6INW7_9HYPH|nr:AraC family transcriptional regulator [Rhizobium mongolense]MBB4229582.1 AraC-like DNA-binding protein [Rhizobium mongolense]TVZ73253.1 AraC-like protein [Rhizobium mongolense USDA 1844]